MTGATIAAPRRAADGTGPRGFRDAGGAALKIGVPLATLVAVSVVVGFPRSLLVAAAAAAILVAGFAPGVALGAYLLIPYFKAALQPYSPIDLTVVLAALNAAQAVPLLLAPRRSWRVSWPGIALWVGIGGLLLLGTTYAPDGDLAIARTASFWALVVAAILPAALRVASDDRYVRQLLWTLFAFGALVSAVGAVMLLTTDSIALPGMNTIQLGRAALLAPIVGLAFVADPSTPGRRWLVWLVVPLGVAVSAASGSRGPFLIAALLGLAWLAVMTVRLLVAARTAPPPDRRAPPPEPNGAAPGARRSRGIAGVVLGATVALVLVTAPSQAVDRFSSLTASAMAMLTGTADPFPDSSSATRASLFSIATGLFEQEPLFGVGTAGFAALSPADVGAIEASAYPHDAILEVAAEHGLVGLALFVPLLALAFLRPLVPRASSRGLRALLAFFVLAAMVSGEIFSDRETWALLMLALAVPPRFAVRTIPATGRVPWGGRIAVPRRAGTRARRELDTGVATG